MLIYFIETEYFAPQSDWTSYLEPPQYEIWILHWGYSAGVFQAYQLIFLAVFASCMMVHFWVLVFICQLGERYGFLHWFLDFIDVLYII